MKMTAFWDVAACCIEVDISEVHTTTITPIMKVVHTSETSFYFSKTTWRYIPEGCHLQ
jgi:hypothetical protein